MTDEEILTALESGKTYIIENGWTQHQLRRFRKVCAVGGLYSGNGYANVSLSKKSHYPAEASQRLSAPMWELNDAANRHIDDDAIQMYMGIVALNDREGTTVNDVLAVYDEAIFNVKQRIADKGQDK